VARAVRGLLDVTVVGLLATIQEVLPDLKKADEGAVLISNGALGENTPQMDEFAATATSRAAPGTRARRPSTGRWSRIRSGSYTMPAEKSARASVDRR
jgi:NADP-dependent 3-hydroxy acid dehydrogenase YdfG